jgi:hypothetical protein
MQTRHPSITDLLAQFRYDHLPPKLLEVSQPFADLAYRMVEPVDDGGLGLEGPELTVALRELVRSKDCAVRARVAQLEGPGVALVAVEAELDRRKEERRKASEDVPF